ncbi:MAG: helix-turn-helix domain-containing protein, partial [Peptococcaceae bacterium]|nr:helix-turn-helix domain-containing protein [Peptococcaceae bacterium]
TGTEDGINYTFAGGLVGLNRASISDSYARGAVSGQEDIGGLVGCNSSSGTITNSYSTGAVSGDSYIGGLVGFNYSEGIITDSYWDMDTSHQTNSDGGTGKNTAEMKQQETYVGWDFVATWAINANENDGYPFLTVSAALTVPFAPQNFTATPGDSQVTLSWTAPASDGGSSITKYQVSKDNGVIWTDVGLNTSHTFTGLTNDMEYTFKVRAVNSVGRGAEASVTATPTAPAQTTHTVKFYSDGSLYASITVIGGSALGANWPTNPTKSGYNFGGWFTGQNGAGTQYTNTTIITADVDLHAKWTYSGSSGSVGGDSRGNTPSTPIYKADVRKENGADTTLPVTVNDDGTASIDVGSQNFTQGETVIIIPSVPGVDTYFTGIPVPNLSTTDVQGTLTLNTNLGSITVPSNMLTGVAGADGNKARIAIGQGDKSKLPKDIRTAVGNRPLIQLTLSIDGKQIAWNNPQTPVTVAIPYIPTSEELTRPEHITVWHIDGNGRIDSMDGKYDPLSGTVIFTTTHFNYYAVVYESVARLAGTDRVETGLKIAQAAYPDKISHAVLATANNYPDALAGSVLAYQLDSPLLLVGTSKKDQEKVLSYLKAKLKPDDRKRVLYVVALLVNKRVYKGKDGIWRAKEYIENHWQERFDLGEAAKAACLSKAHFTKLFKKHTGVTPHEYYSNYKISKLKEKLLDTNLSISQAFAACNMEYNGHSARVFKEKTGLSPSAYRKMSR